ncbi:Polysaccharide biosynthesis protein [Flavobacterium anhuiense]|uniref:Polysaccharide biosynthesis protein n=1 Tax=Flavobacterium anhuiense TaxID=459526 RepID=A0AAC9GJL5_9FLAO|nr:O-antigen translocase [Flavobacterium anhuiense]AOC95286.1 Polysaccharide biosynthesis protein [Flavobacterium anhuiense]
MVKGLRQKLKILNADIFKVFSFTAISTLVKMLTSLISVKVIATIIGPSGIALLGQLNSFATIVMIIAAAGINNGVTKYVAEFNDSVEDIKKLLSTALRITLLCAFFSGILMIILSNYLSKLIMLDSSYGYVFIIFGLTVFLYALNGLIASILNGYKEFKLYVYVNIIGSLFGLVFTLILVFIWELKGALISAVTFQSFMFFISLWMIRKLPWAKKEYFLLKIDKVSFNRYFKYSLMTLVTAATAPVAQLLLRGNIMANISVVEAGWWEAMNRISNMYLMIITTSFSVYYLPRLAEIVDTQELKKEIFKAFKIIVTFLLVLFTSVYICRFLIIKILFSKDFLEMQDLFLWQLLGDFFKICSWLLAFLMIAKTMTKEFIISEVLFTSLFLILAYAFMRFAGVVGITQAYALSYFIYFLAMVVLFRKILFNKIKINE